MTEQGSLEVVFEQVKGRIAVQDAQISALDGKANFGLASATLLTAGATALQSALTKRKSGNQVGDFVIGTLSVAPETVVNILISIAILAYVVVVLAAYQAYRVRNYQIVPIPKTLRDTYIAKSQMETKSALIDAWVEAFSRNEKLINDKVWWTNLVLISLAVEALILLSMAIVRIVL